jgi:hypothetical protein
VVSAKESDRLKKGLSKTGVELCREADNYDILMVRGWVLRWEDLAPHRDVPVVYFSVDRSRASRFPRQQKEPTPQTALAAPPRRRESRR